MNILATLVRSRICNNVSKAGFFSIFGDETRDCSKTEQFSIAVRYVDDDAVIHEHFLTYTEAEGLTASSLVQYILDILARFQLDPSCIVSQGYDGAAVRSGACTGVR